MSEDVYASRILMLRGALDVHQLILTRVRRHGARPIRDKLVVAAMLDTVMIALGVGFFVASVLYVLACERM